MGEYGYAAALRVAEAAAEAAARLIAEECVRPEGIRGGRGKCFVDKEAEQLIRDRVTEAFPAWAFLGEETGSRPPDGGGVTADGGANGAGWAGGDGAAHTWVVDPNDGTEAMQDGYRGHAVSIALLREGVPVLGVVRAVNAPDAGGDAIAWAEGCGPLRRNGRPVERAGWERELGPGMVVLVSHGADRHPAGNGACAAPARFRAVPSVAYRLALAAAAEGEVAVGLMATQSWDYAGGHALLRGAGGRLVDERGEDVRYTRHGRSGAGRCFGGAPELVEALAARDWDRVYGSGYGEAVAAPGFAPVRLRPGRLVSDAARLSRAQGAILGQLAGDSLGALVEFQSAGAIARAYPDGPRELADGGTWDTLAGQPTDDSELALALARSIVAGEGYDPERAAQAYGRWLHGWTHAAEAVACGHAWCRPFDVGGTTRQALGAIRAADVAGGTAARAAAQSASRSSQANGALMRVSPIGVWGAGRAVEEVAAAARADAALTHPHPVCADASAAFAVAVAHAVETRAGPEETWRRALGWAREYGQAPEVAGAIQAAAEEPPGDFMTQQGWVLVALRNAFFRLLHAASVEEGVVATVRAGGDTDTNAAICGALLGAVHGREAVPAQWHRMVLSCRPLAGQAHVKRPRPAMFWPVDALQLAELLLLAGRN